MNAVLAIGRILFAYLFVMSGIGHLSKSEAMGGYAKYKKVPTAKLLVIVTGLMILVGGIFVALGIYADLGALLIAIFLIPTALMMHNYWKETTPEGKMTEMVGFNKDIALAGAALILFVLIGRHTDIGWHITAPLFNFR
jgi:putative oxidoreductase